MSASPLQLPPSLSPVGNFITKYKEYADVVEAPPEVHELIAMLGIATILNKNGVYIQHGSIKVPLDLWLLVLADSGIGKNTVTGIMRPLMEEAGLHGVLRDHHWASPQAFYQDIAEKSTGLFIWPEMASALKNLSGKNFSGVKEWLTDRYDEISKPSDISYRRGGKHDNPPIIFTSAPRLNILATSTPDWLLSNLSQEDTTGGFMPRWLPFKMRTAGRIVPIPAPLDNKKGRLLADVLREVDGLSGVVELSRVVLDHYEKWYRATIKRFESSPNPALADTFFRRHRNQVLKLAVIHEVAQTRTLKVSLMSLEKAIATARLAEDTIMELLPTGLSQQGATISKIEHFIKTGGTSGKTKSQITRAFQTINERQDILATLIEGGKVKKHPSSTGGRPGTIFLHEDFEEAYLATTSDKKAA